MRDLKQSDKNVMRLKDAISGTEIELYYRMPTTSELVAYQRKLIKRQGGKTVINVVEARLEYGLKILTGFREGDFGFDGQPISVDAQSKNYRQDWKELLKTSAADIIAAFAFNVYEGARLSSDNEIGYEEETEERPL